MIRIHGLERGYAAFLRIWMSFERMGRHVAIHPSCDIQTRVAPYVYISDNVHLQRDVWLNVPLEAPTPQKGRPLIILRVGVGVGRRCTLSALNCIDIGANVVFGPGVLVTDHNHRFSDPDRPAGKQGISEPGRVIIEEGCWLGCNAAVITHGGRELRIGRNSVVGANAVVTRTFPPDSVLTGVPAKNIRHSVRSVV